MRTAASNLRKPARRGHAFTLMEVMVSALLISIAMGNILMMNMRSAKILRASRELAAASQMLQQRVEMVRDRSWSEVASSKAMAALMKSPTDSEAEINGARVTERLTVTVPKASMAGLVETDRCFTVCRTDGAVTVEQSGDFNSEPTLLLEGTATWHDQAGVHQRVLRTVVCRFGLTRSGIVGTVIGRPSSRVSSGP